MKYVILFLLLPFFVGAQNYTPDPAYGKATKTMCQLQGDSLKIANAMSQEGITIESYTILTHLKDWNKYELECFRDMRAIRMFGYTIDGHKFYQPAYDSDYFGKPDEDIVVVHRKVPTFEGFIEWKLKQIGN